jgi:hypothetical protein
MRSPGFVADFSLGPLALCYRSTRANRASSVAGVMLSDYANCDPCSDPNCPGTCSQPGSSYSPDGGYDGGIRGCQGTWCPQCIGTCITDVATGTKSCGGRTITTCVTGGSCPPLC